MYFVSTNENIQTCTRMKEGTSLDRNTWWHVDLGGTYNVYNIMIQFKDYEQYNK